MLLLKSRNGFETLTWEDGSIVRLLDLIASFFFNIIVISMRHLLTTARITSVVIAFLSLGQIQCHAQEEEKQKAMEIYGLL